MVSWRAISHLYPVAHDDGSIRAGGSTYFPSLHDDGSIRASRRVVKSGCDVGVASQFVTRWSFVAKRGDGGVFFVADGSQR